MIFFFLVFADFVFVTFVSIQLAFFPSTFLLIDNKWLLLRENVVLQRLDSMWESKQVNLFY